MTQPFPPTLRLVRGALAVTMIPQNANVREGCAETGQLLLEKQYSGDLAGVGTGQMLTAMTDTKGSGAYVAIERITGSLKGKQGSFVLQHTGCMSRSVDELSIRIVPDSGSGELAGITGAMTISTESGQHFYHLHYGLPGQ